MVIKGKHLHALVQDVILHHLVRTLWFILHVLDDLLSL
jgi:hypothetical protein